MARIVPSQVVELIDRIFPSAVKEKKFILTYSHTPQLAPIVYLIQQIPSELLTLSGDLFMEFYSSLVSIKSTIESWQAQGNVQPLESLPGFGDLNPLFLLRRALVTCLDEFPSASTAELAFINDTEFRVRLRSDLTGSGLGSFGSARNQGRHTDQ
jgi:hypothetical protein